MCDLNSIIPLANTVHGAHMVSLWEIFFFLPLLAFPLEPLYRQAMFLPQCSISIHILSKYFWSSFGILHLMINNICVKFALKLNNYPMRQSFSMFFSFMYQSDDSSSLG